MRRIEKLNVPFKKEMTWIEVLGVEKALENYRGYRCAKNRLGLAYTSSSDYAMYNVTEFHEYQGYEISHFAITENNMIVAVCRDDDENDFFFELTE